MGLPSWCVTAHVFDLPMTTQFRGIVRRHGMLLRGEFGWAEWSPFAEYDDQEAAAWLRAARLAATQPPSMPARKSIPVNCTVPATSADHAAQIVAASGCATAKVKVAQAGQTLADDLARVEAVRAALGASGKVRIDVNGGWSVEEALRSISALRRFDLEYVEQPCADVRDLAELRRRLAQRGWHVRIAADESIRRAQDPYLVRDLEAADIAVIKVQPLGGVQAALDVADQIGLPVVVSSALESSVGLRLGVECAAALPELDCACGLNTARLLAADVSSEPLISVDGYLPVLDRVEPDTVAQHLADAETTCWWLDRLARVDTVRGR